MYYSFWFRWTLGTMVERGPTNAVPHDPNTYWSCSSPASTVVTHLHALCMLALLLPMQGRASVIRPTGFWQLYSRLGSLYALGSRHPPPRSFPDSAHLPPKLETRRPLRRALTTMATPPKSVERQFTPILGSGKYGLVSYPVNKNETFPAKTPE